MDVSKFSLKGKVAIVIGGAGDIGKAIAQTYSTAGADVVISSRKQENLDKAAEEIKTETGGKILPVASHIAKMEESKSLVERVKKELGRIDLPGRPCGYGAMSFGQGRLYLALQDGQLLAFEN